MKRISKRELRNRFDLIDEVRVHVDSLQSKSARVSVDGVECDFDFPRSVRWQITRPEGVSAQVVSYPNPANAGFFPKGTKPDPDRFIRKPETRRPCLNADGQKRSEMMAAFARQHPVGTMVLAKVLFQRSGDVALEFENGVRGRLKLGHCCDHEPFRKVRWLAMPSPGETVEVIVREFNWRAHEVFVSMHKFRKDDRYCTYAAGFRGGYNIEDSPFERLPWEK